MVSGPRIKESGEKLVNLSIYDIIPAVLHMFGLPVPDDIDGRVLTEIFKTDSKSGKVVVKKSDTRQKDKIQNWIMKFKEKGLI
ncbi:MAG: hypothetical protein J7L19_07030 [Dehalococcoidia bacterium]|nr:hypothetical protein [Dehalococcoidia bacterium]